MRVLIWVGLMEAVLTGVAVPAGADPADAGWPPVMQYSLGKPTNFRVGAYGPVVAEPSDRSVGDQTEITVTASRRAPVSSIPLPVTDTPQSVFNIGGNPFRAPADCPPYTTTIGGQPASPGDLAGQMGVRGCYF